MKSKTIIIVFITLLFVRCSNKPDLTGFLNYQRFDEFALKGVNKIDSSVIANANYVSIKDFGDSIKVYSHLKQKFYNYYKNNGYWISKQKYYDDIEVDTCYIIKYIFNDTVVDQRYYISATKSYNSNKSDFIVRTKNVDWSLSLNTVGNLSFETIRNIISDVVNNNIDKNHYILDTGSHFFKISIMNEKIYQYVLPENYIEGLPEICGYSIDQLSTILNLKIDTINSFIFYNTVRLDSISEYYLE